MQIEFSDDYLKQLCLDTANEKPLPISVMKNNHGVFNKNGERIHSADLPFHPGEILETELEARNIKKSVFALNIKMYPAHITDIIKGRRNVSAATALKFEKELNIDADFWMRAQADYDLAIARRQLITA